MKKDGVRVEKVFLLIFGILIGIGFIFAAHDVYVTNRDGLFNFNTSAYETYNISINNTVPGDNASILQVNITFPAQLVFGNFTNATSGNVNATFTNTTYTLSWTNITGFVVNGSNISEFRFDLNATAPGGYNLTVETLNDNLSINRTNVTIRINDTIAPSLISFVSPGLTSSGNYSQNSIPVNISATDDGDINRINISFSNTTSVVSTNITTNETSSYLNFTGFADGNYRINATINDSYGNSNSSNVLNITIDTTTPTNITFTCDQSQVNIGQTITCSCTADDATSGVLSTTITGLSTTEAGSFTTTCTAQDYAGNNATGTLNYDVYSSSAAPGTGGGGGGTTTYTKTYVVTDTEFKAGYTQELKTNEKVRIKVNGITHNVGVTSLSTTTATVSIFSTPQEATLQVGDIRKFDVNDNGYYDISVKLESITNSKAKVVVTSINELITAETIAEEEAKEAGGAVAKEEDEEVEKDLTWLWILIIVVILVLVGIGYKKYKK